MKLRELLEATGYDQEETDLLCEGFTNGFRIGYAGPGDVKIQSNNLRFAVGNKFDLWNKIMLEVRARRYAGPYDSIESIPFPGDGTATGWIQSPCGLVPKSGGRTRLINHHSFPPGRSLNDGIPDEHAKVTYQDLQDAIKITLQILKRDPEAQIHYSKLDGKDAFRVLCLHSFDRRWQVLKAENPLTQRMVFFVDLCVCFGNRASCFLYEKFSRALAHVYACKAGEKGVSYLDDSLQVGPSYSRTNEYLGIFLDICSFINMPIADEKTVFATQVIIFLGMRINALTRTVEVPQDKVDKAMNQLDALLASKKATVLQIQKLTGLLNFFCRAIVPGRTFTRRMYASFAGNAMRPHHHVRVTGEMKLDLGMWRNFLEQENAVLRPFLDFDDEVNFIELPIFSDAAKSPLFGYSTCFLDKKGGTAYFCSDQWDEGLIEQWDPSIQFLELYALAVGVILFAPFLAGKRSVIFCDNQAVIQMVTHGVSSCKHCMILIRRVTLCLMQINAVLDVKFVPSEENKHADLLSRMRTDEFKSLVGETMVPARLHTPPEFLPQGKFFDCF